MEILTVRNLSFTYPQQAKKALEGIDLTVKEGDFVVICGPSGSGKTTLLRLLKRELAPFGEKSGEIRLFSKPIEDKTISPFDIGFVMQNPYAQLVTDKVWHELSFTLENMEKKSSDIRRITGELASFFGITAWYHKQTDALSGGQVQLLNLAAVMAASPRLLLLDEPLSQLDPVSACDFIQMLIRLNRELSLTVVIAEHRLETLFSAADQVVLMDQGKIVLSGAPKLVVPGMQTLTNRQKLMPLMPSAVQVFTELSGEGIAPLTVRQGRDFLQRTYKTSVRSLPEKAVRQKGRCALALRDIWFRYEKKGEDILKGLCLSVYERETLCILGANGAGKSTLLQIMASQYRPYSGKLSLLQGKTAALLPQNPVNLFLKDTVKEDYMALLHQHKVEERHREERIRQVCTMLAIADLLDRHPLDLSGGQQQKAALGKLLLLQPQILLLDEPTKGIDAAAKQALAELFLHLTQTGLSIVVVTHDVEFAAVCADRCALLFDGQIVSEDTPAAFFCGNSFYTTAASLMSRTIYDGCITCADVVEICRANGKLQEETV